MYYQKHITARREKRCKRTLLVLIIVISFFTLNAAMCPIIESMIQLQAEKIFTRAVNDAVLDAASGGMSYDSFVTLTTGESGEITSVQTNSMAVNKFKSSVSQAIAEKLDEIKNDDIGIPIGSLTGIEMFTGRGPSVKLRLVQNGSITADISDSFSESGINQTCHALNCDVSARFIAVIPGVRVPVELKTTVVIAQSIIVGEVPDSYTYVVGDESDTIGRIFDYGDPYGADVIK